MGSITRAGEPPKVQSSLYEIQVHTSTIPARALDKPQVRALCHTPCAKNGEARIYGVAVWRIFVRLCSRICGPSSLGEA